MKYLDKYKSRSNRVDISQFFIPLLRIIQFVSERVAKTLSFMGGEIGFMKLLKIQSFNVNGIRAVSKKLVDQELTFKEWIMKCQPDILGLQETKAWSEQVSEDITQVWGYQPLFLSKPCKKGYSGVGLYIKDALQGELSLDFFGNELDEEGRVSVLKTNRFTLLNVYFPNGAAKKERLDYKMRFYEEFLLKCQDLLHQGVSLIVMGDVNTAHREIDLTHPKANEKTSGFLPLEREWITRFLSIGFVDTFRHFYPDRSECYSWWDLKTHSREKNVGWRIDYIFISQGLLPHLKSAEILTDIMGSDHCPIQIELEGLG